MQFAGLSQDSRSRELLLMVPRGDHDDRLLLDAAAGDAMAYRAFQRRHLAAVGGFLLRRTGHSERAGELAAETFAAALLACPRYRPGALSAREWLLRIAEQKLRESRRSGRVASSARRQLALERISLGDDGSACDRVVVLDPDAAILHLVGELTQEQREAVIARVVEERGYADIAGELACSEEAARAHVVRGLAVLRERLVGDVV